MSADQKYEQAIDNCNNASQGQRSFCMIEARHQHRIDLAKEQKKGTVVHHDYDSSNDTPAQTKAKEEYERAADKCADLARGQRSSCMIEAHEKYRKGMGW